MIHNENSRVKIPALVQFTRLGYKYLSLKEYTGKDLIDEDTNIFIDLLCAAINRINDLEYTLDDSRACFGGGFAHKNINMYNNTPCANTIVSDFRRGIFYG